MSKLNLTSLQKITSAPAIAPAIAPFPDKPSASDREESSYTMHLLSYASSDTAKELIAALARSVIELKGNRNNPSKEYFAAMGAAVGDLLTAASYDPPRPCYRPLAAGSFKEARIGYHPARRVIEDLLRAGFISIDVGKAAFGDQAGFTTRIRSTVRLIDRLRQSGITPANRKDHFCYPRPLSTVQPIRLTAASKHSLTWKKVAGKRLPVDLSDPVVAAMASKVQRLNAFMANQTFSFADPVVLFRTFNLGDLPSHDFKKGGRICCIGGGYQQLPKKSRREITINGLPTIEIDISACHLTVAHGILGLPLPDRDDLYAIRPYSDAPRDTVKAFVTSVLGAGKLPTRWHPTHIADYLEKTGRKLVQDFPIKSMAAAVLSAIPALNSVIEAGLTWADLQYVESEIMFDCIFSLAHDEEIVALPIHDSLIVPEIFKKVAMEYLSRSFHNAVGIYPILKE